MQTATQHQPNDTNLSHFLRQHQIDSFNKVWFLLFLWQRSEHSVNRAFARIATFTDERTLDEIIGKPVEKFRMRRPISLSPEVAWRCDDNRAATER